jgi:drug/metabolite transporter (DMT)-like permease
MIDAETLTIVCGLGCALTWGAGDFSGGLATRHTSVFPVTLVSQFFGITALGIIVLLMREPMPTPGQMGFGAAAGIAGMGGILALYSGLARGRMGIVAPVSAVVTALLPVAFAFVVEGFPGGMKMVGFAVALAAVWYLSYDGRGLSVTTDELRLALYAGSGFGMFFIFIERASTISILWPLIAARMASLAVLFAIMVLRGPYRWPRPAQVPMIALAGLLDTAGNALFALAAQFGRLDLAAVVGSLYPATTVFLARAVLDERLVPRQWFGVGTALAAMVLISV